MPGAGPARSIPASEQEERGSHREAWSWGGVGNLRLWLVAGPPSGSQPPLTPAPAPLLTLLSTRVKRPLPVEGDACNRKKPSQLSPGSASERRRAAVAREGAEALGGTLPGAPTGWQDGPSARQAHAGSRRAPAETLWPCYCSLLEQSALGGGEGTRWEGTELALT